MSKLTGLLPSRTCRVTAEKDNTENGFFLRSCSVYWLLKCSYLLFPPTRLQESRSNVTSDIHPKISHQLDRMRHIDVRLQVSILGHLAGPLHGLRSLVFLPISQYD